MRNHNHAKYKLILSYSDVDGAVITDVDYCQEHPLCLESLRSYIRTGTWAEGNAKIASYGGGTYDSRSHAIYLYEQLPSHINRRMSERCAKDESYAAMVMAEAAKKAKEVGENLGTAKANITRMRNKGKSALEIAHEYFLILRKYRLFNIVDFDFEAPVCACCGKTYPLKYTIDVNNEAYCMCCANDVDRNQSHVALDAAVVRAIKDALHENPNNSFLASDEQINYQIQHFVSAQTDYLRFVNCMATYYNAGEEGRDLRRIYDRVWKELTIERFNANINKLSICECDDSVDQIAKQLMMPRFDLEDVSILLKQMIE